MTPVFINNPLETFTPTESGAIATHIWECCRAARERSVEPVVITRQCAAASYAWPQTLFLDFPKVPSGGLALFLLRVRRRLSSWRHLRHRSYAQKVAGMLRKHNLTSRPLILHNDPETAVFLRRRFPKAFIVHHFHNQLDAKPAVRRLLSSAVNVATGVSSFTAQWSAQYYGLTNEQTRTVYNGVDPLRFSPDTERSEAKATINFLGRTGIEKAPDLLLRAAKVVARQTKNFRVQILGSNHWQKFEMDDYQRELQSLSSDLEREGITVSRPGHIDRASLPGILRKVDIHVVPSRWDEPFGLTTLEGMASQLAVVASRTGGTPELIGDAGLLFDRDSVDGLAMHLGSLLDRPDYRMDLARKARVRATEFTWDKTWERFDEVFALAEGSRK